MQIINYLYFININNYRLGDLFWNITLILFTFYFLFSSEYIFKHSKKINLKIIAIFLFALFWIFLANSLYLITESRHLLDYCPRNSYTDICPNHLWMIAFFSTYTIIGWLSFYYLLKRSSKIFKSKLSKIIYINITLLTMPLALLLGLYNRLNSWQIISNFKLFLNTVLNYFTKIDYFTEYLAFLLSIYLLYIFSELIYKKNE